MKNINKIALVMCILVMSLSVFASAATVTVGTVDPTNTAAVAVNFTVDGLTANDDQVTILVYKGDAATAPSSSNIVYLNQITYVNNVVTFALPANAEGTYQVLMGGTSVQTASRGNFTITVTKVIYGDVNGDGKVNVTDAVWVLRYDAEISINENENVSFTYADVNGDGKVNVTDAVWILRYDAEITIDDETVAGRLPARQ